MGWHNTSWKSRQEPLSPLEDLKTAYSNESCHPKRKKHASESRLNDSFSSTLPPSSNETMQNDSTARSRRSRIKYDSANVCVANIERIHICLSGSTLPASFTKVHTYHRRKSYCNTLLLWEKLKAQHHSDWKKNTTSEKLVSSQSNSSVGFSLRMINDHS